MEENKNFYHILEARNGEKVPALVLVSGQTQALHSLIDPKREAQKLLSTAAPDTGFFVFLGLGGGFAVEEALEKTCAKVLIIDFNKEAIESLLSLKDYSRILKNERVVLLIDPSTEEIENFIANHYRPAISGGIKTIPLRARIDADRQKFEDAASAVTAAIEMVANDYSVQAHFGKRWFSNIIRNLKAAEAQKDVFTAIGPVNEAAIAAAGPSLDLQLTALKDCKSRGSFLICADTALPVLLHHGIEPDAVVSIDCQHISYYHFMGCGNARNIPLFLDIASPPLLRHFSSSPVFFSSAHPLAIYISQHWKPLPLLDTSGGNVTYACLSLAENLGAKRITLFGADFSYVNSSSYARGTYIFPFFEKKQNRLAPMEALFSAFLYRSPFIQEPKSPAKKSYHETAQLRFYREKLEQKAAACAAQTGAQITSAPGLGAPINLPQKISANAPKNSCRNSQTPFLAQDAGDTGASFLRQYSADIAALPSGVEGYLRKLNDKEASIFTTLLPLVAAFRHRRAGLKTSELIDEVKEFCVKEIRKTASDTF